VSSAVGKHSERVLASSVISARTTGFGVMINAAAIRRPYTYACPDFAAGTLVRKQIWAKSEHKNNRENKINKNPKTVSVVSTQEQQI